MKAWFKKVSRSTKKFWNTKIRPRVEPALRIFVIRKAGEELDRASRKWGEKDR